VARNEEKGNYIRIHNHARHPGFSAVARIQLVSGNGLSTPLECLRELALIGIEARQKCQRGCIPLSSSKADFPFKVTPAFSGKVQAHMGRDESTELSKADV
jgi:hypothetical protein